VIERLALAANGFKGLDTKKRIYPSKKENPLFDGRENLNGKAP